ncbi:MAG TPA: SDR family oxidoreductase [Terriglobales bacterium]|nr:SDR family oxidoreductase [Terriglobales bacterium]
MSASPFEVEGRTILITGGAGLLGRAYARALARAGANVAIADIDLAAAEQAAQALDTRRVCALPLDVTEPSSVSAAISETVGRFGAIDGLVNNAASDPKFDPSHAGAHTAPFESFPLELWNRELAVNLTGSFLCAQSAGRVMRDRGRGTIVNISSIYGLVGPDQRLYEEAGGGPRKTKPVTYSVSKSAVIGLTRYLAAYWAGTGIRVNTLVLGGVENGHDPGFLERYGSRNPLGRMAQADEYCGALMFLLSDASSYMTGADLIVDGGWTAW